MSPSLAMTGSEELNNRSLEQAALSDQPTFKGLREDPLSAMAVRFNWFFRAFATRYFRHFSISQEVVKNLRALEARGSVVYVMRYASRLDYFLFNFLFLREGLRLSKYANGIRYYYFRTFVDGIKCWLKQGDRSAQVTSSRLRGLIETRQSLFLFLRTSSATSRLRSRRKTIEREQRQLELLAEIVRSQQRGINLSIVPIALFWRKGPQPARRFVNFHNSTVNRPSDLSKISAFLIAYRDMTIKIGDSIDLETFCSNQDTEKLSELVRRLRRKVIRFLATEERVVEGPRLISRKKVQRIVLNNEDVKEEILKLVSRNGGNEQLVRSQAEKMFREISSNINPTLLAISNTAVSWLFRKLFVEINPIGIDRVANYAREQPIVLVPSHRSYFDFLILSWLFYRNNLVPPHIAARENMGFGPFGFIFRRLGAFFLRRSFDSDLYKSIFRSYLGYLVNEGFTQEFFIEGGRSRTGKSLSPKLGVLSWILEAFAKSGRRELLFVPVGISYDRIVEEKSMLDELEGGSKSQESVFGLLRARSLLRYRFGDVQVRFGEPISAADLPRENCIFDGSDFLREREKRTAVAGFANSLVERINWSMVVNGTSVISSVLIGGNERGLFRDELIERGRQIVTLLSLQDVPMTKELTLSNPEFSDSIDFLHRSSLIGKSSDLRGEIFYFEESKRKVLGVYRNVLTHFIAASSFSARSILGGTTTSNLRENLSLWLDVFYLELFVPSSTVLALHVDAFLDYFDQVGVIEQEDGQLNPTGTGLEYLRFLATQTRHLFEAYGASFRAVLEMPEGRMSREELEKRAEEGFKRSGILGEIRCKEAWSSVTFQNSLDSLVRRGVLLVSSEKDGRDMLYERDERYVELLGLEKRLAAALSDG